MTEPRDVTDDEFEEEVLRADLPVLVDFWAEWCVPCKGISRIIEELAPEYDGKVKFVKLDTEENFDITDRYGVRGLPTLLMFKGGEQVGQMAGARRKSELKSFLDKVLD